MVIKPKRFQPPLMIILLENVRAMIKNIHREIPVSLHPPKFPLTIRDKNYIKPVGSTMLKPSEVPTKERKINQLHLRNKVTKV